MQQVQLTTSSPMKSPVQMQQVAPPMPQTSPIVHSRRYSLGGAPTTPVRSTSPSPAAAAAVAVSPMATPGSTKQPRGGLASDSGALLRSNLASHSTVGLALFREAEEALRKAPQSVGGGSEDMVASNRPLAGEKAEDKVGPSPYLAARVLGPKVEDNAVPLAKDRILTQKLEDTTMPMLKERIAKQRREERPAPEEEEEDACHLRGGMSTPPGRRVRALSIEDLIDQKLAKVMEAFKNAPYATTQRLGEVESRFEKEILGLRAALEKDREDHQKAVSSLQDELVVVSRAGAAASVPSTSSADDATAEVSKKLQEEQEEKHREVVMTLAAVCKDIEALQTDMSKQQHDLKVLLSERRAASGGDSDHLPLLLELQAELDRLRGSQDKVLKDLDEMSGQVRCMEKSTETGSQSSAIHSVEALSKLTETMRSNFVGEVKAVRAELMRDVDSVQRLQIVQGADIASLQEKWRAQDRQLGSLKTGLWSARGRSELRVSETSCASSRAGSDPGEVMSKYLEDDGLKMQELKRVAQDEFTAYSFANSDAGSGLVPSPSPAPSPPQQPDDSGLLPCSDLWSESSELPNAKVQPVGRPSDEHRRPHGGGGFTIPEWCQERGDRGEPKSLLSSQWRSPDDPDAHFIGSPSASQTSFPTSSSGPLGGSQSLVR